MHGDTHKSNARARGAHTSSMHEFRTLARARARTHASASDPVSSEPVVVVPTPYVTASPMNIPSIPSCGTLPPTPAPVNVTLQEYLRPPPGHVHTHTHTHTHACARAPHGGAPIRESHLRMHSVT